MNNVCSVKGFKIEKQYCLGDFATTSCVARDLEIEVVLAASILL
jgi:hypothetical protein